MSTVNGGGGDSEHFTIRAAQLLIASVGPPPGAIAPPTGGADGGGGVALGRSSRGGCMRGISSTPNSRASTGRRASRRESPCASRAAHYARYALDMHRQQRRRSTAPG